MGSYNSIRAALDSKLASAAITLPDIIWPNTPYDPDPEVPFIRVTFVPSSRRPSVTGYNPEQRYQGVYTILICTPKNTGSAIGISYADTLTELFNATTDLYYGDVFVSVDYSEVGLPYLDDPYFCTPITVGWHSYN